MKRLIILIPLAVAGVIAWQQLTAPPPPSAENLQQSGEETGYQENYRYENAKSSMHQIAFALEDYYVDHRRYPKTLEALSDPQAPYTGFLPDDPYSEGRDEPFLYETNGEKWVLMSRGPDGDFDFDLEGFFA